MTGSIEQAEANVIAAFGLDDIEPAEDPQEPDHWTRTPNRAARRRFVKMWQRQKSSRNRRGQSLGRKPKERVLKVSEFLAG